MKPPSTKGARFAKSFKGLGVRFSFAFFILLTIVTLATSWLKPESFEKGREIAGDTAAPALSVLQFPAKIASDIVSWSENIIFLYRENKELRAENELLKTWHVAAERLTAENERLRSLLGMKSITAAPVASARVVGQSSSNFVRSVIVNAGTDDNVEQNNTVLDQTGVVGRVMTAGKHTSRVLLLTDLNSRVPVKVLPSEVNAILAGDNSGTPSLIFIPGGVTFNVGDWIVTTGHGGVFPPDLPIGRISSLPQGAPPRVALTTDYSRLDMVRIYKYTPPPAPVTAEVLDDISLPQTISTPPEGFTPPGGTPAPAATPAAPATAPTAAETPAAETPATGTEQSQETSETTNEEEEEGVTPPPESVSGGSFE